MSTSVRRAINAKIEAGDYYDAQQMVKTAFRRLGSKGQLAAALDFCVHSAGEMSNAGEHDLAADLGNDLVDSLVSAKEKPSSENLALIEKVMTKIPAHAAMVSKYRLLNSALKWSAGESSQGHPQLHRLAAESYLAEEEFGKSQNHLVYCGDGPALAALVRRWRQRGYPNEQDLFSLRVLLMLLALNDTMTARTFWNEMAGDVFSSGTLPQETELPEPVVQCGSFLLVAAEARSIDFFRAVRGKYALVLRRDSTFEKYLDEIESRLFGVQKQQGGLGAIFDMLMGSGGSGG